MSQAIDGSPSFFAGILDGYGTHCSCCTIDHNLTAMGVNFCFIMQCCEDYIFKVSSRSQFLFQPLHCTVNSVWTFHFLERILGNSSLGPRLGPTLDMAMAHLSHMF